MKKIITFIFVCLIGLSSLFMSSCGAKFKLNFIVDDQGYLYIIYAYGNTTNTTKIDVIIFE